MLRSLLFIFFTTIAFYSFSCSCHMDIEEMNMSRYNDCAAVFIGKVDSLGICSKEGRSVTFSIQKKYKGDINEKVIIEGVLCKGSCAFDFEKHRSYLVYLFPDGSDQLRIQPCTGTRRYLTDKEIHEMQDEAEKYNSLPYLEKEIALWKHEMDFLENILVHTNGKIKTQYPNGTSTAEGKMKNGKPVGEWTYYYPNGNIKGIGHYQDGMKTGYWIEYTTFYASYEDTSTSIRKRYLLRSSGRYEKGHKEGKWERVNLDGSVITLYYRRGKFITDKPEGGEK